MNLQGEEQDVYTDACKTYEVKLGEPTRSGAPTGISSRKILKRPNVIPDEVVRDRSLRCQSLAYAKPPAQRSGVGKEKQHPHIY